MTEGGAGGGRRRTTFGAADEFGDASAAASGELSGLDASAAAPTDSWFIWPVAAVVGAGDIGSTRVEAVAAEDVSSAGELLWFNNAPG
ncbi:MAG: hypothetical protein JO208_14265 [Alphaproteobacteria bacterium]|nr:hypothetical protein [Alphaproteobacteria bacterium]